MFRQNFPLSWLYHRNSLPVAKDEYDSGELFEIKEYSEALVTRLPPAAALKITKLLSTRRSCREFTDVSLSLIQLSTVVKHSYGCCGTQIVEGVERYTRCVPSAGAIYPLELYVIANKVDGIERGIYHYAFFDHSLEKVRSNSESAEEICHIFLDQEALVSASAIIVVTTVFDRIMSKYGDRGYRYILIETGHLAQNAILSAEAIGLGSLPVGGFNDLGLASFLGLDPESELPIYAIALGNRLRKHGLKK